jgi:hypothetical protein
VTAQLHPPMAGSALPRATAHSGAKPKGHSSFLFSMYLAASAFSTYLFNFLFLKWLYSTGNQAALRCSWKMDWGWWLCAFYLGCSTMREEGGAASPLLWEVHVAPRSHALHLSLRAQVRVSCAHLLCVCASLCVCALFIPQQLRLLVTR